MQAWQQGNGPSFTKKAASSGLRPVHTRFIVIMLIVLCVAFFGACHQNGGERNYQYTEEETALLRIATERILDLEKNKDYIILYRDQTSKDFRKRIGQRDFLKLTHCVETFLGGLTGYDPLSMTFVHRTEKGQSVDLLNLRVYRQNSGREMVERFVFIQEGLEFRLKSIRWLSTRDDFMGCMEQIIQAQQPQ